MTSDLTSDLIALVPTYGLWLIAATTFLSCLALPVPSSLMMLTAGGFVAAGDLGLGDTLAAALGGAVLGDQAGFALGRSGGARLLDRIARHPRRAALIGRTEALMQRRGGFGIFLSRWLFSPLGPWMNFAAGAARLSWRRFTLAGVAGETVWVALYVGTGAGFAGNLTAAMDLLGSSLGFLAAGAVTLGLGLWLRQALRPPRG
ncbi:DedA family protein [Acidimangrovimonas sediminis]|uniref:DedA family protein n=1 Tax=Acidimangrovimonas sediminis TaxID=2056283 RepID=UPI000C804A62|nr:DedA family protein [Acidimangrovimonas sediminis]